MKLWNGTLKETDSLSSEQDEENDDSKNNMHLIFITSGYLNCVLLYLNGISKSSCDYGTLYKMSQAWISNICKLTSQYLKIEKEKSF